MSKIEKVRRDIDALNYSIDQQTNKITNEKKSYVTRVMLRRELLTMINKRNALEDQLSFLEQCDLNADVTKFVIGIVLIVGSLFLYGFVL